MICKQFNKFKMIFNSLVIGVITLILLLNSNNQVYSQTISDTSFYSIITESITNSNVELLTRIVNKNVDIVLPSLSGIYSRHQSKFILKSFFEGNKPESFHLMTKNRQNNSGYFIGKLHTSNKHYRVCFLTKRNQNRLLIYQIRIEE